MRTDCFKRNIEDLGKWRPIASAMHVVMHKLRKSNPDLAALVDGSNEQEKVAKQ